MEESVNQGGVQSLKPQYHTVDPELRALQEENARLKKIIGNQALELEFKTELLKKTRLTSGDRRARKNLCASKYQRSSFIKMVRSAGQQFLLQKIAHVKKE